MITISYRLSILYMNYAIWTASSLTMMNTIRSCVYTYDPLYPRGDSLWTLYRIITECKYGIYNPMSW